MKFFILAILLVGVFAEDDREGSGGQGVKPTEKSSLGCRKELIGCVTEAKRFLHHMLCFRKYRKCRFKKFKAKIHGEDDMEDFQDDYFEDNGSGDKVPPPTEAPPPPKCHHALVTCVKNGGGILQFGRCMDEFRKCVYEKVKEKIGDKLGDEETEAFDEDNLDDGSGSEQSCKDKFKECIRHSGFFGKVKCTAKLTKCYISKGIDKVGEKIGDEEMEDFNDDDFLEDGTAAERSCKEEFKKCIKDVDFFDKFKCGATLAKCYIDKGIDKAGELGDEVEAYDEDMLDDGSGAPEPEPEIKKKCRDEWKECRKSDGIFHCGKVFAKCVAKKIG